MEGRKTQSAIVTLQDGKNYKADFDMGALANAEMAYERYFGKKMGVNDIITELVGSGTRAMMSFMYGAMISAGEKITWEYFSKSMYTFANVQKLIGVAADGLTEMMRTDEEPEGGDEKNVHSRGAT